MSAKYFIGLLIFVVVSPSNAWVYQCKAYPTTKKCDHFMFSQLWPPTFCKIEKCSIPTGVNTWTIYGLWPDAANYYLSFCYPKQVFDPNSITRIHHIVIEQLRRSLRHLSETKLYPEESIAVSLRLENQSLRLLRNNAHFCCQLYLSVSSTLSR
ncbi:uncharacterized protein [Antedon mediterranea]|uniref:uncharacterized protein isoform X1 n=1 Tax=Antedon mediterranea TaxID=105859 RepID=UPI003AF534E7